MARAEALLNIQILTDKTRELLETVFFVSKHFINHYKENEPYFEDISKDPDVVKAFNDHPGSFTIVEENKDVLISLEKDKDLIEMCEDIKERLKNIVMLKKEISDWKISKLTNDIEKGRNPTDIKEPNPLDVGPLEAMGKFISILKSIDIIVKTPVYYESIVASVTAFETYLRDKLVDLISSKKIVEERFYAELKNAINYDKIREFDYNLDDKLGLIVVEKVKFHDLNQVDGYYRKALNKKKGPSFFISKMKRSKLQIYINLRHLIVHKGGKVDRKYRKETGCSYEIGEFVQVNEVYIAEMIGLMKKVIDKIEKGIEKEMTK